VPNPAIELAEAIRAHLAAGIYTITPAPAVTRGYSPIKKKEEVSDPIIIVVPRSRALELQSRTSDADTIITDVAVIRAVDPEDNALLDEMSTLANEVFEWLGRVNFDALEARWTAQAQEPLFSPQFLVEQRVFLSVIKVTHEIVFEA